MFGLPAALGREQVGGGCMGASGRMGVSTCTCTCMHTHEYMYRNLQMATDMEASMFVIFTTCMYIHACVCMCVCVYGTPPTHPWPSPPQSTQLPSPGGHPGISKNSITLELIKIIQFCLKIWNLWRIPHPWVVVWFGGWVGSGQIIKNFKNVDPIKIFQFFLKIYDL